MDLKLRVESFKMKDTEEKQLTKVELNMDEQEKYKVIKALVEQGGNKQRAALKLDCCRRTINRHIAGYKAQGKAYFIHGNRGRQPRHTLPKTTTDRILDLYKTKYYDCTYALFTELLASEEAICVSESTVRALLKKQLILSPKSTRRTRRAFAKASKQAPSETVNPDSHVRIDTAQEAHPSRPRCPYFGEMIQMDASSYRWFGTTKTMLHVAIDDATGMLVGAYFDEQETLKGYYHVFQQILVKHGIPAMFYTDRRTVFEYKKMKHPTVEKDGYTQFAYACHQLGVDIKTTSVPQAKGRVERLNHTLQSRLPILLRLAGVTTIEEANIYLSDYIQTFNTQFASDPKHMPSVFEIQPDQEKINLTLAVLSKRKVDNGHAIRFDNTLYKMVDASGQPVYYHKGVEGMVIQAFDHNLFFCVDNQVSALEEIPQHERLSKNFDPSPPPEKPHKKYIPPANHPWRLQSFERFRHKQPTHTPVGA